LYSVSKAWRPRAIRRVGRTTNRAGEGGIATSVNAVQCAARVANDFPTVCNGRVLFIVDFSTPAGDCVLLHPFEIEMGVHGLIVIRP